jgi:DNA-binding protein H-NS
MSVEELLKMRDEITDVLSRKADELKSQLSRLTGADEKVSSKRGRKGRKVPPKYRGPGGVTWAGRGARPRWLVAELKKGKKLQDFAIAKGKSA